MDELIYNEYKDLPEYRGKNVFSVSSKPNKIVLPFGWFIICSIGTAIGLLGYYIGNLKEMLWMSIMSVWLFINALILISGKVKISDKGISMFNILGKRVRHFEWDDIENIHVINGYSTAAGDLKFYISTDPVKTYRLGFFAGASPEIMVLGYSPQKIHCIYKYWNKEIENNYDLPIWIKYVNKL